MVANVRKFKMEAVAYGEHAGVKYAPGQEFYVDSADTRQFLIENRAARDATAVETQTPTPPPEVPNTPEQSEQPTLKEENGTTQSNKRRRFGLRN